MDLLMIISKIWKYKLVTIPLIVLTVLGLFYELEIKPPIYQASANVLLVSPPGTTGININNPFVNNNDNYLTDLANVMVSLVASASSQHALVNSGADPRYQVIQTSDTSVLPIIQITGVGSSAEKAILSANLVAGAIKENLAQVQKARHVPNRDMITADEIVPPANAESSLSGKLRTMIAILGLGFLLLLVVISASEGRERRRAEARELERNSNNTYSNPEMSRHGARTDKVARDRRAEASPNWRAASQDGAFGDSHGTHGTVPDEWPSISRVRRDGDPGERIR
jgi:capsular polysaccharide biosynthesis protein